MELVSIIMPAYNSARFIGEAINSVLAQTYTNWELLIVDDCSKDSTAEIVAAFSDPRIHYQRNVNNMGAAETRNQALKRAQGRYIAFLDSDDLWEPEKLEKQIAFMEKNGYAFTFSDYRIMKENGTWTGKILHMPASLSYHQYLRNTAIGCLTVVIDRLKTGDFLMSVFNLTVKRPPLRSLRGGPGYSLYSFTILPRQHPFCCSPLQHG